MRTSLIEIEELENLIFNEGDKHLRALTEAKLLTKPQLLNKAIWQLKSYEIIRRFGREKLTSEIESVESLVFTSAKHITFQNRIRAIFNP